MLPRRSIGMVVDADSIETVVILFRAVTVNRQLIPEAAVVTGVVNTDCRLGSHSRDTRLQDRQRGPVTFIQRKLNELL
jgi:hypothetical protein